MSHNRDLSAAAGQFGFHSSNIGIGSEAPRYALDVIIVIFLYLDLLQEI